MLTLSINYDITVRVKGLHASFLSAQQTLLPSAEISNTYGGVYLWKDREAMEAFIHSDIVKAIAADPTLANLTLKDYAIAEDLSRVTRGIP